MELIAGLVPFLVEMGLEIAGELVVGWLLGRSRRAF